ncbi:MAG: hypothetical protein JSS76_04680 [Bacteroidetes bacterium]|nr:hypothetical protein [Bacteroidota bacterium]
MKQEEQSYISGFNTGYRLRQYNPELFEKLKPSLSVESEYEKGVIDGGAEYERTQQKERENDFEKIRNDKEINNDLDKTR